MKKWLTFDLDDTLMKNPFERWVFPEIRDMLKEQDPYTDYSSAVLTRHDDLLHQGNHAEAYHWDRILISTLEAYNIALDITVEDLIKKHAVAPKVYLLEENLPETLEELSHRGFSLAAVTNGWYKYQFPVLDALGIANHFDQIITPSETGTGKPDPCMANTLLEEGEFIAHIGDRIDHDVHFSKQMGAYAVLIDKNMPDDVRKLPVADRNQTNAYRERWQEIGEAVHYQPHVIIHSVHELVEMDVLFKWLDS